MTGSLHWTRIIIIISILLSVCHGYFSDTFKTPDWFTFGKVRASYAAASNGTKAYQNLLTYKVDNYQSNGQPVVTINNSTVPNKGLKPVQISEWEIGLNLSFLDNRLSLDAA